MAIAGILVLNPDILVLDEPTAGLDPEGTKVVLSLIEKLNKEGKTIILVTHDMNIVNEYADEVVVLKEGKVVYQGDKENLFLLNEEELSLDVPPLFAFAKYIKEKGLDIDLGKVRNISSLLEEIKRVRK